MAAGERVIRVAPKMMGESRRGQRTRGKSDPIDALAIARAALKEGPETFPGAHLDEKALEIKLLLDHREDLVKARSEDQQRLRWHLHDLSPELEIPAGALDRLIWLERISRKLARTEQSARVRIARELVCVIRQRTRRAAELEREIGALVRTQAPGLLQLPGCGRLTAAMRVIAGRLGGRRLKAPRGTVTRPTSDRVREALFAMLGELDGASVLDLFAGSGALGIEAISRGAASAVFVERDARAATVLHANLAALGIGEQAAQVRRGDALAALQSARADEETYDLVFIDPPYSHAHDWGPELTASLPSLLRPEARVVVESDRRAPLELRLDVERQRRYGDTLITIHRHQ